MKFQNDNEKQCFEKVIKVLPKLIKDKCNGYDELWGYKLNYEDSNEESLEYYDEDIARSLVYKICKGYQFEYDTVIQVLVDILKWRSKFNPLSAAFKESHNEILQSVGILTSYPDDEANKKIITWNLYGKIVKHKELFADSEAFIRYRIGLMERGLKLLDFTSEDNSYMTQVHDYKGVSVFKMDPQIKSCTKQTIAIFQKYYPELLFAKYFVNVPSIFSWVYDFLKSFINEETRKKFVVLNDGKKLGKYLKSCPAAQYEGVGKQSLEEQNVEAPRPTPYGLYLLEQQASVDID
ncbi:hypothetical protein TPHA_0A04590 [Tetrapisispora phaffii CBS 4417]|uniref:Phosphatidylinositol transfer protein SFH5 n=1 Tax=Tetrapisispora phaffii (strain ATCC 24235 / CBS 4417 / NBRC 1672 / NRRL Y-8282 / UCD 70-5) TaxID=1071381 RepID=G8BNQ4_TETPH|nr:hypothetical protein TPHA_0A04590 [Tetrapisispora phaffii CBS 4417]CCE61532.1 hypothetical protein TPHA_0A04590 [Tetrapisispora phaffii CBS 4417]